MGLFENPEEGADFERFVGSESDGPHEVFVDRRFLTQHYVIDSNLVFSIEGYGRFRLWFDPPVAR